MRILLPALAILTTALPLHAAPKDIAELFPATTLAYLEVRQPGAVGKQLAAFMKGSALENALPALNKVREQQRPNQYFDSMPVGLLSTLLGPEMLKEAERFQGLAIGLTGFGKQGEPEYLAVLLPGDSQLPGFLMRGFLSASPGLRKMGEAEGIAFYQESRVQYYEDPLNGVDAPPRTGRASGPLFAYEPGIVLLGSSKEIITGALRRFKDKEKSTALAQASTFKKVAAQREPAGLFLFADARSILERLDASAKNRKEVETDVVVFLRRLLPARSVETLTARLELKETGFDLVCSLGFDSKGTNPLAELLSGPGLTMKELPGFGQETPLVATLNLPQGDQRLPRLLSVLDLVIKATGTLGPTASEMLQELNEKKVLSSETLAKVDRVSLALPPLASWPKTGSPLPTIFLHAESSQTLDAIEAAIPAILELLGGAKADAVTETIDGIKIRSLEAKANPMGSPIHYARHKETLAIGADRRMLAAGLKAARGTADSGDGIKSTERVAFIALWNWAAMVKTAPVKVEWPTIPDGTRGTIDLTPPPAVDQVRGLHEAAMQLEGLPPLIVTLSRQKDDLRLELRQADPKKLRTKAIDRWFDWFIKQSGNDVYRGTWQIEEGTLPLMIPPPPLAP